MTTEPQLTLYSVSLPWNRNDSGEGNYTDWVWATDAVAAERSLAELMADTRDDEFASDEDRQKFIENLVGGISSGGDCRRVEDRILADIRALMGGPSGTQSPSMEVDVQLIAGVLAKYSPAPPAVPEDSFTVWSYDSDLALHHANDLKADTFESVEHAAEVARQRALETSQNTGFATVVDNSARGHLGDSGFVVEFKKDKDGRVFESAVRGGYEGRFTKKATAASAPRPRG